MRPRRSASAARPEIRRSPVLAVCVGTLLMMAGEGIVGPILPLYAQTFGVGVAMIGMVVGAAGLARVMITLPAGSFSDSIGRRPLLVVGPVLTATAALLAFWATGVWQLLTFRFLAGAGNGLFMTGSIILLGDIADPRRRVRGISLYRATIMAGVTVGPIVGGLVAEAAGLRAPFLVVAGSAAAAAVWSVALVRDVPPVAAADGDGDSEPSFRQRLGQLVRNSDLLLVSLITFNMFFILIGARLSIIPLVADARLQLGAGALGGIFAVISVSNLLAVWPAGSLAGRLGRKPVIVASGFVSGASLLLFAAATGVPAFVIAAVLMGVGTGLASPSTATYAAEIAPFGARGTAMGLHQMLGDSGFVVGPLLLGWLSQTAGFGSALILNAALAFGAALLFGAFARETLVRPPAEAAATPAVAAPPESAQDHPGQWER